MVRDEVLGLGPIDPLIHDDTVQEIMINAPDTVYVERDGVLYRSDIRFRDESHVRRIAERILAPIGRRIDEGSPMVDARLPDGSRVNITVPPATPRHVTITIRKFRKDRLSLEDLMAAGTMDERMAEFIGACTANRLNILISGGTGTGKTTLLNAVSSFLPRSERIITIENPLELTLQQPHVLSMEARPPISRAGHEIIQRDLLRNSLRMRPDRIIVGEVRGAEAFEMLQAMNTGHNGSMRTSVRSTRPSSASLRERPNPEFRSFVQAIVHAQSTGVPLGHVLRTQSTEIRLKKRQRAEEAAQKASQSPRCDDLFHHVGLDDDPASAGDPAGLSADLASSREPRWRGPKERGHEQSHFAARSAREGAAPLSARAGPAR